MSKWILVETYYGIEPENGHSKICSDYCKYLGMYTLKGVSIPRFRSIAFSIHICTDLG